MKKLALTILFISFFSINKSIGQDNSAAKNSDYCILRVYGRGWAEKYSGIFIIREDLKIEKKDFKDDSSMGILTETMENFTLLKNEGYTLISSNVVVTPAQMFEYIFKKQK